MALTKKRRVFIEEYLRCWNGAEAARRAGYKHPRNQASYLLTIPNIQEEIEKRIEELAMRADEVLLRLAEQARGLSNAYFRPSGELDATVIVANNKTHLVKKTKRTQHGLEIELYDSQRALVDIGRALGIFKDRLIVEDWRKEAEAQGLDSAELFKHLVHEAISIITAGNEADDSGSVDRGESAGSRAKETD